SVAGPASGAKRAKSALTRIQRLPRGSVLAGVFLITIALSALLAPFLPLPDPVSMEVSQPIARPSVSHPFGTDSFGRDLLSRIVWGARISLVVALASVAIGGGVGIVIGLVASSSSVT